ncbi:MAG TPA: hypothetical protein VGL92_03750, partial [Acidimicrobiia bacterium]
MGLGFPRRARAGRCAVLVLAATLLAGWSGPVVPAPAGVAPPSLRAEVRPEEVAAADVVVEAEASLPATDRAR